MAKRHSAVFGITLVVLLFAAACGNSPTDTANQSGGGAGGGNSGGGPGTTVSAADLQKKVPITADGVTDTEIRVGGVASVTNILQADYNQAFNGAQAYFDMINSKGGIYGRKLVLTSKRDDQMVKNTNEAQALVSQDKVFAVLPVATLLFTGAQTLADANVPTFGWNINDEWGGPPNLFGDKGSYLCADCAYPTWPFIAKKLGAKNVGLIAYGSQPQSKQCSEGIKKSFDKWPDAGKIVFEDTSVEFGATDVSVPVSKMKAANVDLVLTCVDSNGALTISKELKKQQSNAVQYLPNGYDFDVLQNFGDVMEGSIVGIQFWPFESTPVPASEQDYLTWIAKVPGGKRGEVSAAGWMDAQMLVEGLKLAGPDFSREKVVAGLNSLTNWTADGMNSGVNWTIEHTQAAPDSCATYVKIQNKQFVPIWAEPGKPYLCIPNDTKTIPENPTARS